MRLLELIHRHLDDSGVPHAVIGAAALAAAGVARSTFDLDVLVVDPRCLEAEFWNAVRAHGALVDLRRGDSSDPLAGVVRIEHGAERPVDIIVGRSPWQSRALARARRVTAGPPIVQPRDLILLKLYAGGIQDLWDVRQLLSLPDADALAAGVEEDLRELPVDATDRWRSLLMR
jgi:hypothetical protein